MKLALAAALCVSTSAIAADYVQGYTRRDGTYVAPHYRSEPNSTKLDNYSSQGNFNPYTGQSGTVNNYNNPYNPPRQDYSPPAYPSYPQPSYNAPNPYQSAPNPYSNPYRR